MTNKNVIETIKTAIAEVEWNYPMDYAVAFEKAIDALENQNKYRWHDLRKDPNDLPKVEDGIMVLTKHIGGYGLRTAFMVSNTDTIAWREIEPFEEV